VVVRLWRADGDEARQLKWFTYAVTLGAVAMALGLVVFHSPTLGVLAAPVVPLAAGLAIVKYRLYDIDAVINKTLVVGGMAGMITAAYAALVVVSGVWSESMPAPRRCFPVGDGCCGRGLRPRPPPGSARS